MSAMVESEFYKACKVKDISAIRIFLREEHADYSSMIKTFCCCFALNVLFIEFGYCISSQCRAYNHEELTGYCDHDLSVSRIHLHFKQTAEEYLLMHRVLRDHGEFVPYHSRASLSWLAYHAAIPMMKL